MHINVITNLTNGVGLQRDYELLRNALESLGHEVHGVQFNAPATVSDADLAIFLEVVPEKLVGRAPREWAIPNPEWWFVGWDQFLPRFELVWAKTRDCERMFRAKRARAEYLNWCSRDLYRPEIARVPKVLHVAGKSELKNTRAVLDAWRAYRPKAELLVISHHHHAEANRIPGVTGIARVSDEQMAEWMNACQFHLLPSAYEGWGHALHESLGVGAVVITTAVPPMNEIGAPIEIPARSLSKHHSSNVFSVAPKDVATAVNIALAMGRGEIQQYGATARERFLRDNKEFRTNLERLV